MTITDIQIQAKNPNRVNISIDGKYRFSLDVAQVGELGVKRGLEVTEEELRAWEDESQFGKLYAQALEYSLMRPHAAKEVRDYLWRKTLTKRYRARSGEVKQREGTSKIITERVYDRLVEKGYVDDAKFARFWVENRHERKGISTRKLVAELRSKGVDTVTIEEVMQNRTREEKSELRKVIERKKHKYDDEQKLVTYLARQGFSYDDIRDALSSLDPSD